MIRPASSLAVAALLLAACGCGLRIDTGGEPQDGGGNDAVLPEGMTDADAGPFGPARSTPLLAPFAGTWVRDFEKTLAVHAAAGATAEEIAQTRAMHAKVPQLAELGSQLTITGDLILGDPFPFSEYRLFGLHSHGAKVCGKAWHHEDRFDPGDVSKCYVRLQLVDGDLHMETRMLDGSPDLNDPDLQAMPVESPADGCNADNPAAVPGFGGEMNGWSEWSTTVYVRQK